MLELRGLSGVGDTVGYREEGALSGVETGTVGTGEEGRREGIQRSGHSSSLEGVWMGELGVEKRLWTEREL